MAQRSQINIKENQYKVEDDNFFILLSAANDNGQEVMSVDNLLSCSNYTTRRQLEKYLDEIVNIGLYRIDKKVQNNQHCII